MLTYIFLIKGTDKYMYYYDDYCLALVLKGVCFKHRGMDFQAEQCFREVWQQSVPALLLLYYDK